MVESFASALSSLIWAGTVLIIFRALKKPLIDILQNVSTLKLGNTTFDILRQNIQAKNPLPAIGEERV